MSYHLRKCVSHLASVAPGPLPPPRRLDTGLDRFLCAGTAQKCLDSGICPSSIRATLRFLVVAGGYGSSLGAFTAVQNGGVQLDHAPGKFDGAPGNAFSVVYEGIEDKVIDAVHRNDPVLGIWIQRHLYGDIFSSPGLPLRLMELMMIAFLAEAHMPAQLFGHCRAAFRLGVSPIAAASAAKMAFEFAGRVKRNVLEDTSETIKAAWAQFKGHFGEDLGRAPQASASVALPPDGIGVGIPERPVPFKGSSGASGDARGSNSAHIAAKGNERGDLEELPVRLRRRSPLDRGSDRALGGRWSDSAACERTGV